MIRFDSVSRSFGSKLAVDALSLEIPSGEVFAFLGPNGAGKTTTIKMLVGLLRPSAGAMFVGGHDICRQPREVARLLGYVPDLPFLYEKLSGREFLEFVGSVRGMSAAEIRSAVERLAEQFEADGYLNDLSETYSHGMRQRVVFAAALLHNPPVLVVDEPMVGLDPKSARMVKDLLRRHATEGGTVFMSTHTLSVAEEIADRIGIIHHGKLRFLGTVPELQRFLAARESSLEPLFLKLTESDDGRQPPNLQAGAGAAGQPLEATEN